MTNDVHKCQQCCDLPFGKMKGILHDSIMSHFTVSQSVHLSYFPTKVKMLKKMKRSLKKNTKKKNKQIFIRSDEIKVFCQRVCLKCLSFFFCSPLSFHSLLLYEIIEIIFIADNELLLCQNLKCLFFYQRVGYHIRQCNIICFCFFISCHCCSCCICFCAVCVAIAFSCISL